MAQKIQRWLDLLAALLRRNYPIPFEELIRDVPGYQDPEQAPETRRRMFERDKDELRAFGIGIKTHDLGDNETGYGLDRKEFYLPYLEVLADGRMARRTGGLAGRRTACTGWTGSGTAGFPCSRSSRMS